MKTPNKKFLLIILPLLYLALTPAIAHAATITTCTFSKETYNQGNSGYITLTVYNDEEETIRVIELTAAINYYYEEGTIYIQTFYAPSDDLPVEIEPGQTDTFTIPFSLPNDIAPGYTDLYVKAKTEIWNTHSETWYGSDHPTYEPTIYVESPYKQFYENQQETNDQLEQQLREQQAVNNTTTNIVYLLAVTTLIFAAFTAFLTMLMRRPRAIPQPAP
ncbi:MAG: hypothetical protein WCC63_06625 [Candidatus Bathyarchaeia archaeon]